LLLSSLWEYHWFDGQFVFLAFLIFLTNNQILYLTSHSRIHVLHYWSSEKDWPATNFWRTKMKMMKGTGKRKMMWGRIHSTILVADLDSAAHDKRSNGKRQKRKSRKKQGTNV